MKKHIKSKWGRLFGLLFLLLGNNYFAFAQNQSKLSIEGIVKDTEGIEMIGVNVIEVGTSNGTITDFNGRFQLNTAPNAKLRFSFIGMIPQEVIVNPSQTNIQIVMEIDAQQLDELVVIGYQKVDKKEITGAVAVVDQALIEESASGNALQAMQGKIAGVKINQDGTPGGGSANIRIRGVGTFGNNNPLYIIDGVPTAENLNLINPNDIESMQILKDGAAASIYGSRAANGVVIITTKKGKSGKTTVNVNTSVGIQVPNNNIDVMNTQEWANSEWQAMKNDGATTSHPLFGSGATPVIPEFIDDANTIQSANTNWFNELYNPALIQEHSFSVSSGNDKVSSMFSASYFGQDGVLNNTYYDRITARLNNEYKIRENFRIGENFTVSNAKEVQAGVGNMPYLQHPIIPVYDMNGGYGGPTKNIGDMRNPVAILDENQNDVTDSWRVFGNAYLSWDIIEGLNFNSNVGIDYVAYNGEDWNPAYSEGIKKDTNNRYTQNNGRGMTMNWSNVLNYNKTFGKHNLGVLAGTEFTKYENEWFNATRWGFDFEDDGYVDLGSGTGKQLVDGGNTQYALFSTFGKASYDYDSRYYASLTMRWDATSRLGAEDNSGIFPAVTAGWRISEESFMADFQDVLSNAMIRVGWGQTGNQAIGDFSTYSTYIASRHGSYDLGGLNNAINPGYILSQHGNSNLKWETTTQTNIGLDLEFFNGRINTSVDYFYKKTDDILVQLPMLAVEGEGAWPYINGGSMINQGLELMVNYSSDKSRDFNYDIGLNIAHIKNEVIETQSESGYIEGSHGARIADGYAIGSFYGYVYEGIFQSEEEVENHATQPGAAPGRMKFSDVNGDGVINSDDRTYIGDPFPDMTFGLNLALNYKQFSLSMFFDGQLGGDIYNTNLGSLNFADSYYNRSTDALNAWTPENSSSEIPALSKTVHGFEKDASTYYLEDASYLKLRTIQLSYVTPDSFAKRLGCQNIKIFAQADNVLTLTGYSGMDPEVSGDIYQGIDSNFYPMVFTMRGGLNITF